MSSYIIPNWPAPENVKAYCTTRLNGFSGAPYNSFNLGNHVGDEETCVQKNREKLKHDLVLPNECLWLEQIHGINIISSKSWQKNIEADGCYSNEAFQVCTVMTADCLPLLLCSIDGTEVMALHGGWRSLAAGIISKGISLFHSNPSDILVWLGPCINQNSYEVGPEVREKFLSLNIGFEQCFKISNNNRWLLDLYNVAKIQLNQAGVIKIFGDPRCTFTEKDFFFSYRRDCATGRMASLIYRSR